MFNQVSKLFYRTYPDKVNVYDFIAIFPSFNPINEPNTYAGLHSDAQNNVRGICKQIQIADQNYWGSAKLQSVQIYPYSDNNYNDWVSNPNESGRLLLEETAHQWLVNIGKPHQPAPPGNPPDGLNRSCLDNNVPLHNTDDLHWSEGLQMPPGNYGAMRETKPWVDNGNGIYSVDALLIGQPRKFHPFDLYLMGLINKSEVTGSYLLLSNIIQSAPNNNIPNNGSVRADVQGVTLDDIIGIAGEERSPDVAYSQKDFNIAFVILKKPGQEVSPILIQAINSAAQHFPAQWAFATDNRSTMNK